MKEFFAHKQQVLLCVLAVGLFGGFTLICYLPLSGSLRKARAECDEAALAVIQAQAQREQLPALGKRLRQIQDRVGNYRANIPEQRALGGFLHKIAEVMDEHKLKGRLVQPGRETQAGRLGCIPVEMCGKGRLAQIFEFYKSLQNLDRLVRIEQVQLRNSKDFSGQVSMQMKAVVYYRPQKVKG